MDIQEFKKLMADAYVKNDIVKNIYGLDPDLSFDEQFSAVSLENIIFTNIATAMFFMQRLLEQFKIDVSNILSSQISGRADWYAFKALLFQYGKELVPETDYYDNSGLTEEQITAMRVVKYAATEEPINRSILYLKVAGEDSSGIRTPLSASQLTAFKQYINEIQYAGVRISIINAQADDMKLEIDVYYDPLVLDETGKRLDGSADTPIQDAIRNYLYNLPFNGLYTNQALVDNLQVVEGVCLVELKLVQSKANKPIIEGEPVPVFSNINAREIAYSGYYNIDDENLILNFILNEETL